MQTASTGDAVEGAPCPPLLLTLHLRLPPQLQHPPDAPEWPTIVPAAQRPGLRQSSPAAGCQSGPLHAVSCLCLQEVSVVAGGRPCRITQQKPAAPNVPAGHLAPLTQTPNALLQPPDTCMAQHSCTSQPKLCAHIVWYHMVSPDMAANTAAPSRFCCMPGTADWQQQSCCMRRCLTLSCMHSMLPALISPRQLVLELLHTPLHLLQQHIPAFQRSLKAGGLLRPVPRGAQHLGQLKAYC